jgi:hypothetical protein
MTKKTLEEMLAYNNLSANDKAIADALDRINSKPKPVNEIVNDTLNDREKRIADALHKLRGIKNSRAEQALHKALASNYPSTRLEGKIRAYASVSNPLTTELELVITLLDVANGNKQGIRRSEASNIISTALHTPLKVNYTGSIGGHYNASVAGVITEVTDATDRILGRALLWNSEDQELVDYLKEQSELYTSWEIFYASAEQDSNGVQWLTDCVFAGVALVSNPAYGKEQSKARIL